MNLVVLGRLALLLALVEAQPYELPMDLTWEATPRQVFAALRDFETEYGLELGLGTFRSDVDEEAEVIVGQFGFADANDADLSVQAYFDVAGDLLAFYARTEAKGGRAFDVVAKLEDIYFDAHATYNRYYPVWGNLRVFTIYEEGSALEIHVNMVEPTDGGEDWDVGVLYLPPANRETVGELWPLVIENLTGDV